MNTYKRHPFPPYIISYGVWLYFGFNLSHRDIEDLLAERGIEVFMKINGKPYYLWRTVDQDGEVFDVYLQAKRDGAAAKRFFKWLLCSHGGEHKNSTCQNPHL